MYKTLFSFAIILVIFFSAHEAYAACGDNITGGSGTVGSPYLIDTPTELAAISNCIGASYSSKYFKLNADIDLNVSPYNTGTGWTPIGTSSGSNYFYGKFDGNFKTISNLYFNNSSASYAGLFGVIGSGGTVSNLILSNPVVSGNIVVGSLTGSSYGTISKVGVSGGSVTGIQRTGGLIGSNFGSMTQTYSNNTVYFNPTSVATCCAGGLAGEAYSSGTINNSYSRSNIIMTYNVYNQGAIGGLYGNDYSSGTKTLLYSTGSITMVSGSLPSSVGGLGGSNYTSTTSSYWDTQTSGLATSGGGSGVVGKTTTEMKTQGTYSGWDFSTIWTIDGVNNNGYPYLMWQSYADVTAPTITSVSSDKANGSYKAGEVIDIDVTFSEAVTSTGNVTVTLETGTTDQTCTFTVTASTTGTCNYTVQAGDTTSDLTVNTISGTIADASLNAMSNFTPTTNLAANKAIVIDTTAPVLTESTPVTTPTLDTTPNYVFSTTEAGTITYGGSCSSGTTSATLGSNTITFSTLTDGTYSNCTITITDTATNASNTLTITSFTIDTTAPTISSISSSANKTEATITWTTNENSSSIVSYGLTNAYGTTTPEIDTSPYVTSHSVSISGLTCATTYHFKVVSKDSLANTSVDNDTTLTTSNCQSANEGRSGYPLFIIRIPTIQSTPNNPNTVIPTDNLAKTETPNLNNNQNTISFPSNFKFTTNIKSGKTHSEVRILQEFLNNNNFIVSPDGPGSKGQETDFFGIASKNALKKFQQAHDLQVDGIFGPITRNLINTLNQSS